MSKYYKAEDVDLVCIKNFANGDVLSAIRNLPTIEVSEDCISREQVRAKLDYISYAEKDPISIAKRIVENAPSVVPKWCIGEVDCPYVIDQDCGLQKCSGELSMEEQYKNCPLRRSVQTLNNLKDSLDNRLREIYNQGYKEGYKDGVSDAMKKIADNILSEVEE